MLTRIGVLEIPLEMLGTPAGDVTVLMTLWGAAGKDETTLIMRSTHLPTRTGLLCTPAETRTGMVGTPTGMDRRVVHTC